jgi:hypothetical protein
MGFKRKARRAGSGTLGGVEPGRRGDETVGRWHDRNSQMTEWWYFIWAPTQVSFLHDRPTS